MGKVIFECTAKAVKDNGKKIKCTVKLCSDSLTLNGNFGSTFSHGIQFNNLRILTSRLGKEKLGLSKKNCVSFEYNSGKSLIKVFIKKLKFAEEFANKFEESKSALIAKDVAAYKDAIKHMEKNSITGFENAIKIFNTIKYHEDSNAKIKHCENRIAEIKEAEEKKRKNDIYSRATTLIIKNDKRENYVSAIKLFETILDWRDSDQQIKFCRNEILKIDKNDSIYQEAKELMKKDDIGELKKVIDMFESIGKWKDSNELKERCKIKIKTIIYKEAVELITSTQKVSNGDIKIARYNRAIAKLEKIRDWEDSAKLICDCKNALKITIMEEEKRKDKIYSEALELMKSDTIDAYTEAEKRLLRIEEWKDSSNKIEICRTKIVEIKKKLEEEKKEKTYQEAVTYKNKHTKNDCEIAARKFQSIKGWKDSAKLLQDCKNEIRKFEQAEELQRRAKEKQTLINSEDNPEAIAGNKDILKNQSSKICEPFLSNPYYILGISCKSTKAEALSVQDKIEKFAKLGKSDLYKSKYDLLDIEKPNRDLSNIQSATMDINNIKHKWFWFISSDYCKLWKLSFIFDELDACDKKAIEYYDTLLSCYFKMLVEDSNLSKATMWAKLLRYLSDIIANLQSPEGLAVLKNRFTAEELQKYSDEEILNSFKENIFAPIIEIINEASMPCLIGLLKEIKRNACGNLEHILKCISERIVVCMKNQSHQINNAVDSVTNKENPKQNELNLIEKSLVNFKNYTYTKLPEVEIYINKMYIDRIYSIFRDSVWSALGIYENANQLQKVLPYATLIYPHCDGDDKRRLRNSFAEYDMDYFEKDFTNEEYIAWGLRYVLGEVVKQDTKRGIRYISGAANRGYVEAQFLYGLCYLEGKGVSQSNYSAKDWFLKAASKNHANAMFNLCKIYLQEENITELKKWAIKSAKLGNKDAVGLVEAMIKEGLITSYDWNRY